ncbi:MAG: hypothetical protein KGI58_04060 [Patescibacteria group bacterium]|nr:hypothetical protein [Patescibacteria group bacterium]
MPLPLTNNDIANGLDDSGLPLRRVIIDGSNPSNDDNSPASFDQRFIAPTQPDNAAAIQEYLAAKHYFGDSQRKVLPVDYVKSLPDIGEPLINSGPETSGTQIGNKLVGTGGEERYITWPEKVIRDALSAPSGAMANNPYPEGSEEHSAFEDYRNQGMVPAALNMSALAGTGGLAGAGEDAGAATLGAGPFLRPALKYQGKIYKAPVGGQHMDAIPANLQAEFTRQAMNGEDISNFNFGFMNHKGHFLNREDALKYAIDEGLLSPHDAKFGALTSTLMADSSKEAAAIDAAESYRGQHTAPDAESGSPLHDVTANGTYPNDFYSHDGLRYYGTGDDSLDAATYNKIVDARNNPDKKVPIYRAIP